MECLKKYVLRGELTTSASEAASYFERSEDIIRTYTCGFLSRVEKSEDLFSYKSELHECIHPGITKLRSVSGYYAYLMVEESILFRLPSLKKAKPLYVVIRQSLVSYQYPEFNSEYTRNWAISF